ncbi:hypothetical protein D0861_03957 [Hortaea werneckii]|uniref:Heterokaryon incompatibility domain-containing protein n=1 Tax=Hortaea werneckii TaxID=91943 RepID=A0A3M7FLW1_HORWE|nr:hypothetical protein D0861_03957 [Hortaea werneckii]
MDLAQNRDGAAPKLWPLDRESIWKPLDKEKREIRILLLQPSGEEDDALYADLEIVSLDREPKYKAISYVWGDALDTTVMFVNGGKVIEITKSLAAALRRFRHSRIFVALWADAVCINQENLQERADQVSIMGKIYASAIQVNVWLGRTSDRKWHDSLYSYLEAEDQLRTDALLQKQEAFFERFVGEVVEVCGPIYAAVEAKEFAKTVDCCAIMANFNHLNCQNGLDKVYGLLGLSTTVLNFPIDYRKTVQEVFVDFAISCIVKEGPRGVFISSTCGKEPNKLPSWVPDWKGGFVPEWAVFFETAKLHGACPATVQGLAHNSYSKDDTGKLGISALVFDRLDTCGPKCSDIGNLKACRERRELEGILAKTYRQWQKCFQDFQEVLLQVLWCNNWADDNGRPEKFTPGHFEKIEHLWRRIEDAGANQEEEFRGRDDMTLAKRVVSAQLFLTAKGRLGNAQTGLQAGDLVTLFPDCSMPFILRPVKDGAEQQSFKLISPCYIHGIMDGEALWDAFMAKADPAEKTAFQKDFESLQEKIAVGIEDTEQKALRTELADKHCRHLFEEIVLV